MEQTIDQDTNNEEQQPYLIRALRSRYSLILGVLAIVTVIELIIAESLAGSPIALTILAVLSIAKMVLVALYYMHLYGDNPIFTLVFLVPIPFVGLIVAALLIQFLAG